MAIRARKPFFGVLYVLAAIQVSCGALLAVGCRKHAETNTRPTESASTSRQSRDDVAGLSTPAISTSTSPFQVGPWLKPYVPPEPHDFSNDRTLYVVNYSHLDTQWRWSFRETIEQFLPYTVRGNVEYFKEFPNHVLSWSGAGRYQLLKEYHPDEYQMVKEWVAKGRWFPAGNQWEECDVLVPSSESILRQILVGRRFFNQEFGTESQEFLLPDSFGFPASLPSLLAHAGIRGFSTQKLTWKSAVGIPFNVGRWKGVDGRGVIAALNPGNYGAVHQEVLSTSKAWTKRLDANGQAGKLKVDYVYNGTGDVGGPPHQLSMQVLEQSLNTKGPVKVVTGPADLMFRHIGDEQAEKLPAYQGDFLLTEHSAGSLTSQAFIKRQNRINEILADEAERASVTATLLGAVPYPTELLAHAWRLTLRGQFHDILPGTSIPRAYEYSWNDEFLAMNQFGHALTDAVAGIARGMDTRVEGIPLVVFNPLSISRADLVEAELPGELGDANQLIAIGPKGEALATQLTTDLAGKRRVLFMADVPALSFTVFGIKVGPSTRDAQKLSTTPRQIGNERYRVTLNDAGDVSSIFDIASTKELLSAPIRLAFLTEWPSEFPAWNMDWVDRSQPPRGYVSGDPKFRVLEDGPLRAAIQVERESEGSLFLQTIRLSSGSPGERVEFVDRIDWKSAQCSLKTTFPLSVGNPKATYNWDLGTIERGNNHPKQYEVPTHSWLDLTDSRGDYGVSLLTHAKYGSDKPGNDIVRLTLLYTPAAPDFFHEQQYQDWGRHDIVYGLVGHVGDWRDAKTHWQADRLEYPLMAFTVPKHPGKLGKTLSPFLLTSDQIAIQALKRAEDGQGVVVRLQELHGRRARSQLQTPFSLTQAWEMTGAEQRIAPIAFDDHSISLDFLPYQLRTINIVPVEAHLIDPPTSVPVPLEYELDAVSTNAHPEDGRCDEAGGSYPAEMLTSSIHVGGVEYRLGPMGDGSMNTVVPRGQNITLPAGYSRVHVLAASTEGRSRDRWRLGSSEVELDVAAWTGLLGQWDNRKFLGRVPAVTMAVLNPLDRIEPAYLNQDRVAWAASHRHDALGDVAYAYSYLFSYAFAIPTNTTTLTLPKNPRLRIFAISVARNDNASATPLVSLVPDLVRDTRFRERFATSW